MKAGHWPAYFEAELVPLGYTLHVSFRNVIAYGTQADVLTTTSLIAVTSAITNPAYSQRQSDVGDLGLAVNAASLAAYPCVRMRAPAARPAPLLALG